LTSHDQLAKDLFQTFFADLLRLAAPEAAARLHLDAAVFLDKQAFTDWPEGDRREMDLLAEVPVQEAEVRILVHIEVESEARSGMTERIWHYYMQLRLRHGLLIFPLLINLKGGRPGIFLEILNEGFEELETARFRHRTFGLSGCTAEEYLALPQPLAWALAAVMRPGTWSRAEQKIACLRRIATAGVSASRGWLLGNWVETYLQLDERESAEYDRLRDLAVNREVKVMEMTWAERMEVEYTRKGVQQGLVALHEVVLRLLGQRFGSVPETLRRRVEAIDSMESLTSLAGKVLEVESIEDMGL
jgi:hypothetical protein